MIKRIPLLGKPRSPIVLPACTVVNPNYLSSSSSFGCTVAIVATYPDFKGPLKVLGLNCHLPCGLAVLHSHYIILLQVALSISSYWGGGGSFSPKPLSFPPPKNLVSNCDIQDVLV